MAARIKVPAEAVRTREQILASVTVAGEHVWTTCWNCGGSGNYASSMIPAGRCRLYCWQGRTPETFGKLAHPVEKYVKGEMARDRRTYRERIRYEAEAPLRAAKQAEYEARRAEDAARRRAELESRAYLGEVGERVKLRATVENVVRFPNAGFQGRTRYLVKFRDERQNLLVLWTEALPVHIDRDGNATPEYATVDLTGTVKSHATFQGERQTVLQRVKCVGASA